ncbi:unnamed protein product [Bemisia tabaci]|uniref:Phosphatidylethanolamine-binding protein n=1 Tax=Bemisia tabaci TaxID=7038 RepID=A0A9P0ACK7_BEMTA|nr:unnamed protein product [Bemisia tabaci]
MKMVNYFLILNKWPTNGLRIQLLVYLAYTCIFAPGTGATDIPPTEHDNETSGNITTTPKDVYTGRNEKQIEKIFIKHGIIPDLIDEAPKYELTIHYVGGVRPDFGTKHLVDELRYDPYALEFPTERHVLYSLFMFDLDSPSRENATKRSYYHWGLANMPGFEIETAEILAKYLAPFPKNGTGPHRYAFLVYKQPFYRTLYLEPRLNHLPDNTHRAKWDIRTIVKKYKLVGPVAGNFLYCEWTPPSANPYMGHSIIRPDDNGSSKKRGYGRNYKKLRTTTTLIPPDVLEPSDIEGPDPV